MDVALMESGHYTYREGDARSTRTIGLETLLSLCAAINAARPVDHIDDEHFPEGEKAAGP
jgi:hypothetical protein